VPSNPDVARVLINRAVVLENVNPTIVPRSIAPRRPSRHDREEKSA
jgi:ATP-dependent Clp protease ATP-binding subunit ClpX